MFIFIESERYSESCVTDCGNEFDEKLSNDNIQQTNTRTDLCFPFISTISENTGSCNDSIETTSYCSDR